MMRRWCRLVSRGWCRAGDSVLLQQQQALQPRSCPVITSSSSAASASAIACHRQGQCQQQQQWHCPPWQRWLSTATSAAATATQQRQPILRAASDKTLEYACFKKAPSRVNDLPLTIVPEFITQEQHDRLASYFESQLRRRRYEGDHWDGVITKYRELLLPMSRLPTDVADMLQPVFEHFQEPSRAMTALHVLDLHEDGYISRHVDSVKFSGDYIIGITLLSPTIMRLHEEGEDESDLGHEEKSYSGEEVTMLLEPRSLYVLSFESRYRWAHEIPKGEQEFGGQRVTRGRRISLIFRDDKTGAKGP